MVDVADEGLGDGLGVMILIDFVVLAVQVHQANLRDFGRGVILKLKDIRRPGGQTRVHVHEILHLLGVAGKNNHQVIAMVFHILENGVDCLLPPVDRAAFLIQGIGLVNEEHATGC